MSGTTKKKANSKKADFLEHRKLIDSTLYEYAVALRSAEGDSYKEAEIGKFFGEDKQYVSEHNLSIYAHNQMQWVIKEFAEKNQGFVLLKQTNFGWTDEIPPKMIDMEISPDNFVQIYKSADLFYQKRDQKLVISIDYSQHNNSYQYDIYTNFESKMFVEWKNLATKKNFYRGQKIDADCRFLKLKSHSWDDIILSTDKKQIIQDNVNGLFLNRELYKEFGVPVKRGIILHGPPGVGKTMVCKTLAAQSDEYSVLYVLPTDFNPQRGGVSRIAIMAKDLAPCLLIIEDIDYIAKDRNMGEAGVVIELMNYLDGLEDFGDVVTLGTTNHVGSIENAMKNRPGRFDRLIEIGNPEAPERERMIKLFTKKFVIQHDNPDALISQIVAAMENLSGSHMKEVCNTAAAIAIRAGSVDGSKKKRKLILKECHFKEAVAEVANKDYSSYYEVQSKNGRMGFGASRNSGLSAFEDTGDDDDDLL